MSLAKFTQGELDGIAERRDDRPRKVPDYETPTNAAKVCRLA